MAYTPAIAVPASSPTAVLDRTAAMLAAVHVQLSRPDEFWVGLTQFRYRLVGAGSWTLWPAASYLDLAEVYAPTSASNDATYSFAGSFFAAGDYEMQGLVSTYFSGGDHASVWSASVFFSMGTPPTAPTITAPAAGSNVVRNQTITYTNAAGQVSQQVQVLNGATVEWDSGELAITGTSQSTTAVFAVNSVTRTFQVRTKSSGGLWSAWATRSVNVSYVPPMTPTLTAAAVDANTLGLLHAITMTITHPTPSGGAPVVATVDVYARPNGSADPVGVRVGIDRVPGTPKVWYGPTPGAWQMRVVAKAADGTTTTSTWVTATGTVAVSGVVLHDPAAPSNVVLLRFNDDGASEVREVESALVAVAGREYPLVEYGAGGSRVYSVGLLHSKGTTGTTDLSKTRALLERRTTLCYRDKRGRIMYGLLKLGGIEDTFYGQSFSLTVEQAYSELTPPSDVT